MSRGISGTNQTASEAAHVRNAVFAKLEFDSGTELLHVGGRKEYSQSDVEGSGGGTYQNVGDLGKIGDVEERAALNPYSLDLQISGLNDTLLTKAAEENSRGRAVTIYLGLLDDQWDLEDTAETIYKGKMDDVDVDYDDHSITVHCESDFAIIERKSPSRYTSEFLKADFSSDDLFDFIGQSLERELEWGDFSIGPVHLGNMPGYMPPHFLFGNDLPNYDNEVEGEGSGPE